MARLYDMCVLGYTLCIRKPNKTLVCIYHNFLLRFKHRGNNTKQSIYIFVKLCLVNVMHGCVSLYKGYRSQKNTSQPNIQAENPDKRNNDKQIIVFMFLHYCGSNINHLLANRQHNHTITTLA